MNFPEDIFRNIMSYFPKRHQFKSKYARIHPLAMMIKNLNYSYCEVVIGQSKLLHRKIHKPYFDLNRSEKYYYEEVDHCFIFNEQLDLKCWYRVYNAEYKIKSKPNTFNLRYKVNKEIMKNLQKKCVKKIHSFHKFYDCVCGKKYINCSSIYSHLKSQTHKNKMNEIKKLGLVYICQMND